jgi:hypothetical protein
VTALNLQTLAPFELQSALEAFELGDMEGFIGAAYPQGRTLAIVVDNSMQLQERGLYEAALVHGFVGCKVNHARWSMTFIEHLFRNGDRNKLRAVGQPLPGNGPFKLYRGVAGTGRARKQRGMSWTHSLDVACWFANRFAATQGDAAIYTAIVKATDIYCFIGDRTEREFICRPRTYKRLEITAGELKLAADRHTAVIKRKDEETISEMTARAISDRSS